MKEPYVVTGSDRPRPRVMRRRPRGRGRSVDRGKRRPAIELRNHRFGVSTLLTEREGQAAGGVMASRRADPTESKTLSMRGRFMYENREIPCVPTVEGRSGRPEKATNRTSGSYAQGKSDKPVVPMRPTNKDVQEAHRRSRRREGA